MASGVTSSVTDQQRSLVQRVASSHAFSRAARMRELLLYIAAHSDQPEELTEQKIGCHVFGRAETYNPADDNIVRASARQLRVKLKEYFDEEGRDEPFLLDVPKGAYVPVVLPRPSPAKDDPPRHRPWAWIIAAGILALSTIYLWTDNARLRHSTAEPDTLFGRFLSQTSGPVRFVLTDSALVVMNTLRSKPPTLEEYSSRSWLAEGDRLLAPHLDLLGVWTNLKDRQITSLADTSILARLLQIHPSSARRIAIRHAKHMQTRDFKSDNFIITGSAASNPSGRPVRIRSQLHFRPATHPEPPARAGRTIRLPVGRVLAARWRGLPGPQSLRLGRCPAGRGPRLRGHGRGGEFLLNPQSLVEVRRLLGLSESDALPPMELLLETMAMEGTATSSRIIAWRRH